jgi:hypothetical protein
MLHKETVWLLTNDLIDKYHNFCFQKNITERFLVQLYDAHLLRGQANRTLKKVEILEESFLELVKHIIYNMEMQMRISGEEKISVPCYCSSQDNSIRYDVDTSWYTATDIMRELPSITDNKIYTVSFINELMFKGILRGRYDKTDKIGLILLPSFVELIKYRDYTHIQNLYFPLSCK